MTLPSPDSAITIRPATAADEADLRRMVRAERLNPNGIHWPNFVLAFDARGLVGAAQLRPHPQGVRELGSLVVRADRRGERVAERLIDTLLAGHAGRVLMITRAAFAQRYARWGFTPIAPWRAPVSVLFNYVLGQIAGGLFALPRGRTPVRLAVLDAGTLPRDGARNATSGRTPIAALPGVTIELD